MLPQTRVFVISLHSATHAGNAALASRLEAEGFNVTFMPGVRGRDLAAGTYFDLIQGYRQLRGHVMTPSEVGCALSHLAVHRQMALEEVESAVVLEDDAVLDAMSLRRLRNLLDRGLHSLGLVSLGGQEGLEHLISLAHGTPIDVENEVWEISPEDVFRLYRSVGYVISLPHAGRLAAKAEQGAFVVDDYRLFTERAGINRVFLCNCIGHPLDLALSQIESERAASRLSPPEASRPLTQRLMRELRATYLARKADRAYLRKVAGLSRIDWLSRFGNSKN